MLRNRLENQSVLLPTQLDQQILDQCAMQQLDRPPDR